MHVVSIHLASAAGSSPETQQPPLLKSQVLGEMSQADVAFKTGQPELRQALSEGHLVHQLFEDCHFWLKIVQIGKQPEFGSQGLLELVENLEVQQDNVLYSGLL